MKKDMPEFELLLDDERAERQDRLPVILLALSLGLVLIWLFTPA